MNLFFSTDSLLKESGGQSQALFELSDELDKENISHTIFTSKNKGINQMNYGLFNNLINHDLIHNFGVWSLFHIYNFYLSKKNKKPFIISPLGMMEPWSLNQKKIKKKIAYHLYQKRILNDCKVIHATSKMEASNLMQLGITKPIEFIPHGTNLKYVDLDLNLKLKISNGKKILLFLSRFDKKKGVFELLREFNKINNQDWVLLISSYENNEYLKAKEEFKENKNIIFYGESDFEIKEKLYSISDFFILPSYSENFGLVIMEALSYSCPVITTKFTPWSHIKNNSGLLMSDIKIDLFNTLNTLFSLSEKDILLFKSKCHYDLKDFLWKKVIKEYIELYKFVLT